MRSRRSAARRFFGSSLSASLRRPMIFSTRSRAPSRVACLRPSTSVRPSPFLLVLLASMLFGPPVGALARTPRALLFAFRGELGPRVAVRHLGGAHEQRALERCVVRGLRLGEVALREVLPLRVLRLAALDRFFRASGRPGAASSSAPIRGERARVVEEVVVADARELGDELGSRVRRRRRSRAPPRSASSSATASYSRRISCARRAASSSCASSSAELAGLDASRSSVV